MGGVISRASTQSSGHYLSMRVWQRIRDLWTQGMSVRLLASCIGRSPPAVSRELSRNTAPWDQAYEAVIAHLRAHELARRPMRSKVASDAWRRGFVQDNVDNCSGSEHISLHLRQQFSNRPFRDSCPETIYQALCRPGDGLPRKWTHKLHTGKQLPRRQRRPDRRTTQFVAAMRSVHNRPVKAQDR